MSAKSKTKSQEKRRKEKLARKAQTRALYASYRDQKDNSKRNKRKKKQLIKSVRTERHTDYFCGNQGCLKCFPVNFNPFLIKKIPFQMPSWIFNEWKENVNH